MDLLERAPLLEELSGFRQEASRHHGLLTLVAGEAGVGKSVFVRCFCQSVESSARVFIGMCDPLSTPKPLEPLLDIAAVMGGKLERLMETENRDAIFRGFLAALQHTKEPAVVVFEDVHWADEATLDLLRFLGRRLHTTHTLLVATYRDDEVGPKHPLRVVLGDLATSRIMRRLSLSPLSESAVQTLAEGTALDPAELHRQTGGNPFYVTEVLASGAGGIPATVSDAVLARAARLSPEGRTVLDAAAVIGSRIEPWLLFEIAGAQLEAAEECLAIGMLRAQGEVFSFRHELAREAVYEALPLQRKLSLHKGVLELLHSSSPDDLAMLAHHAEAAGDRDAVLEYAPKAARRAAQLSAHREAAAQYARALRFAETLPPPERAELLEAYAGECNIIDQKAEAIEARQEAIEIWKTLGNRLREGANLSRLAPVLVHTGRNDEADFASRRAVQVLESMPPTRELAQAYSTEGGLRMLDRDNAEAVIWCERALSLAETLADSELRVMIYNALGTAQLMAGDDEPGVANLLKSAKLALEGGSIERAAAALGNLGSGSGELYKLARAERYLKQTIALASEHDLDFFRFYSTAWLALTYLHQGRWREATDTALSVTQRPNVAAISRMMALVALGRVRSRRGDPEAWTVLDEALELARPTRTLQRLAPVRAARAEASWLAGDPPKTLEEARAVYDLALHHRHPWFIGELAYWRWKAGDLQQAPQEAVKPFALQITSDWRAAAVEWQHLNCPYEAARALAESGDENALKQALATFEDLGAGPAATAATKRLQELGVRGIPRGPRPSTRANPANLTAREVEVLELLGEGLSNPEIAGKLHRSTKTIGHHVSSILAKLEVQSRTEAVREAMRRGIISQPSDGDRHK